MAIVVIQWMTYIPASAQENITRGWLTTSFGVASPQDFSAGISYTLGRCVLVQAAFNSNGNLTLGGKSQYVSSAGLLVGPGLFQRKNQLSLLAGPAVYWGREPWSFPNPKLDTFLTGGVMVNAQAFVTPLPTFGIGLDVLGSLNPEWSGMGARLAVLFGQVR